jgi:ATP-dependent Lon protease
VTSTQDEALFEELLTLPGADEDEAMPVPSDEVLPKNLFVFPLAQPIMWPGLSLPLMVESQHAQRIIEQAASQNKYLAFFAHKHETNDDPTQAAPEDLYDRGVVGRVVRVLRMPDGAMAALVSAVRRVEVERWIRREPMLICKVRYPSELNATSPRTLALMHEVRSSLASINEIMTNVPEQFLSALRSITGASQLSDFVAAHLPIKPEEKQELLSELDLEARYERLLRHLVSELELRKVGRRIHADIQAKVEEQQKQFLLREQLKAIRKELGQEAQGREADTEKYATKLANARLSPEAMERAKEELSKLSSLPAEGSEYHVVRTYLDWLVELPWEVVREEKIDLDHAEEILNADHYGLEEVKERILEALAVRKLRPQARAPVICFVGPPGVGKTSLGKSIARALGRDFFRFSLGGMRDEAELKGHRRTYVGAMPGKILQGIRRAGSRNPVFLLDEIDKLGSDGRGDPSSAMLEVLDPAQNQAFLDHYLDVPFDLSQVMFICTANVKEQIPPALLDRLEVISIPGYLEDEKLEIAAKHLLPRQREEAGLSAQQLQVPRPVLKEVIAHWTREAGVRQLESAIGRLARKNAAVVARGKAPTTRITVGRLPDLLGPKVREREPHKRVSRPGVALGLAWTPVGGEVLVIETAALPGKGHILLTGQLGEVMTESVKIAHSVVRSRAEELGIDPDKLDKTDVHVHFPAGAVPKDGPSAGVTITTALISQLSPNKPLVRADVAMTGEITLTGQVLPVGGIREKLRAAKALGIKEVILPKANEGDLRRVPERVLEGLVVHLVENYDEVARVAFDESPMSGALATRKARPIRWSPAAATARPPENAP